MSGHSGWKKGGRIDILALKKQGMGRVYQGKFIKINRGKKTINLCPNKRMEMLIFQAQVKVAEECPES